VYYVQALVVHSQQVDSNVSLFPENETHQAMPGSALIFVAECSVFIPVISVTVKISSLLF
jgi:hypothetical protein